MSSPVNTQIIILRPRIPVLLGSLIAINVPVQSGVRESLTPRGQFTLSAYQAGLSVVTALLVDYAPRNENFVLVGLVKQRS